jgi:hypothetical protein
MGAFLPSMPALEQDIEAPVGLTLWATTATLIGFDGEVGADEGRGAASFLDLDDGDAFWLQVAGADDDLWRPSAKASDAARPIPYVAAGDEYDLSVKRAMCVLRMCLRVVIQHAKPNRSSMARTFFYDFSDWRKPLLTKRL